MGDLRTGRWSDLDLVSSLNLSNASRLDERGQSTNLAIELAFLSRNIDPVVSDGSDWHGSVRHARFRRDRQPQMRSDENMRSAAEYCHGYSQH